MRRVAIDVCVDNRVMGHVSDLPRGRIRRYADKWLPISVPGHSLDQNLSRTPLPRFRVLARSSGPEMTVTALLGARWLDLDDDGDTAERTPLDPGSDDLSSMTCLRSVSHP